MFNPRYEGIHPHFTGLDRQKVRIMEMRNFLSKRVAHKHPLPNGTFRFTHLGVRTATRKLRKALQSPEVRLAALAMGGGSLGNSPTLVRVGNFNAKTIGEYAHLIEKGE